MAGAQSRMSHGLCFAPQPSRPVLGVCASHHNHPSVIPSTHSLSVQQPLGMHTKHALAHQKKPKTYCLASRRCW